ncbi:hypothetical protein C5Y97_17045 [Blastopirellula marina]|uniref:HTH cro/C1-type domain-containing protein n=2 Tax=Blastopirellula marina TaxID=124 RepID=A0A2S8FPZ9_9BACT|nr:hypothetical protein C5Y98_17035 [Blastopirellula marina]PTL43710.1 hypothetical protein C5Y97_17045 [Blastopirellula marina]
MAVQGKTLSDLRKRLGWTQQRLADVSGYSDRLIRKAEAGGTLHADTIEVLALSLSTAERPVFPEDLVVSMESLVREVSQAYSQSEGQLVSKIHQYFADDIELRAAGDPRQIPFAGTWKTIDGVDAFWNFFFRVLNRPDKRIYAPMLIANDTTCVSFGREVVETAEGGLKTESFVSIKYEFRQGKIVSIDDFFDTAATAKILREVQAQSAARSIEPLDN